MSGSGYVCDGDCCMQDKNPMASAAAFLRAELAQSPEEKLAILDAAVVGPAVPAPPPHHPHARTRL